MQIINCNAAAHWNLNQASIESIWPWNDIHAMQNAQGDLSWLREDRNGVVGHVVWLIGKRHREGWDVREAKEFLYRAADIACRNGPFADGLTGHFDYNINEARRLLQG